MLKAKPKLMTKNFLSKGRFKMRKESLRTLLGDGLILEAENLNAEVRLKVLKEAFNIVELNEIGLS